MTMQHKGDLIVTGDLEQNGQVTGTTYVRSGGYLVSNDQLSGGLIVDDGGRTIINGQVSRNVVNNGKIWLYGQISGQCIGNQPENAVGLKQIVGIDSQVPFEGKTYSFSIEY